MRCDETIGLLSEYIDGVLEDERAVLVRKHLDGCRRCAEVHRSMLAVIGHMREMEEVEPPADFLVSVNERLDRESPFRRIIRALFHPIGVKLPLEIAGVAVAVLLLFVIWGVEDSGTLQDYAVRERPAVEEAGEAESPEAGEPLTRGGREEEAALELDELEVDDVVEQVAGRRIAEDDQEASAPAAGAEEAVEKDQPKEWVAEKSEDQDQEKIESPAESFEAAASKPQAAREKAAVEEKRDSGEKKGPSTMRFAVQKSAEVPPDTSKQWLDENEIVEFRELVTTFGGQIMDAGKIEEPDSIGALTAGMLEADLDRLIKEVEDRGWKEAVEAVVISKQGEHVIVRFRFKEGQSEE